MKVLPDVVVTSTSAKFWDGDPLATKLLLQNKSDDYDIVVKDHSAHAGSEGIRVRRGGSVALETTVTGLAADWFAKSLGGDVTIALVKE